MLSTSYQKYVFKTLIRQAFTMFKSTLPFSHTPPGDGENIVFTKVTWQTNPKVNLVMYRVGNCLESSSTVLLISNDH